jgi:hypothetical protein
MCVQKEKTLEEIIALMEELKDLHLEVDDRDCRLFIELKIKETYYKAMVNSKYQLAGIAHEIYYSLNDRQFYNHNLILN